MLPLKELLGHNRGQTTDKVSLSVNHNNLRSHRAHHRGVVVSHSSSRMRIVTLFALQADDPTDALGARRERAMLSAWTPPGGVKMVRSIARHRARSMLVVPCPSYSDVASQRGGVGRETKAFPPKLVASHQCKSESRLRIVGLLNESVMFFHCFIDVFWIKYDGFYRARRVETVDAPTRRDGIVGLRAKSEGYILNRPPRVRGVAFDAG